MEVIPQTHVYDVDLKWETDKNMGKASSALRPQLVFGTPPEFGGAETNWSPEHLLATSVASCYITTFIHFAKLLKIHVADIRLSSKVEFTKKEVGFVATRYLLQPIVTFSQDPGQATIDNLFAKAKKYCFISNSVKGEIVVEPSVIIS